MKRRTILTGVTVVTVVVVVAIILHSGSSDGLGLIAAHAGSSYLGVAVLVFLDAVCPVFPGETTLNAASTLAAQGALSIWLVMLAGSVGAVVGDSALYWVARLFSDRLAKQVEHAKQNEKVASALGLLGDNAAVLLICGRFVPGVRFVVNCTYGIAKLPYRRFLLWSALGGTIWAVYTCALAYAVGTALADFPLASVIISGAITTVLMGVIFWVVRRNRRQRRRDGSASSHAGIATTQTVHPDASGH
jgi:membrane-associated protein